MCRSSYIDPRVLDHFEEGMSIAAHGWSPRAGHDAERIRAAAEKALLRMLSDTEGLAAA